MGGPVVWESLAGRPGGRWLWSPGVDLLAIAGGGSLLFAAVVVPVTLAAPALSPLLLTAFLHLAVAVNFPHYVATYDLIRREGAVGQRAGLVASSVLALLLVGLVVADPSRWLGLVLRAYLCWSAYHYAAQHYGVSCLYAARGGAPFRPAEKWGLWLSYSAAAVFQIGMTLLSDGYDVPGSTVALDTGGPWLARETYPVFAACAVLSGILALGAAVAVWRRTGRAPDGRAQLLWWTNFVWFVGPNVWLVGAPTPWVPAAVGLWLGVAIPFFHCVQYLGVASHRLRATRDIRPVYVWVAYAAAGLALFVGLGRGLGAVTGLSTDAALVAVMAVLNLQHFFLDGLVWRTPRRPAPVPTGLAAA
jgi:hypothetical protein